MRGGFGCLFYPMSFQSVCVYFQCPAACPAGPRGVAGLPGMKVRNINEGHSVINQYEDSANLYQKV